MCLAVPGKIVHIDEAANYLRSGEVAFGSITKDINLALVPEAQAGDYVLAHAGVAISIINETEARRLFDYLNMLEE